MSAGKFFTVTADQTAWASGQPATFALACASMVLWLATGPLFGFSDAWQLVINTATNAITFLMVFVIQNSQNRDSAAIQAKLDELIRSSTASKSLVGIESLTEKEIEEIKAKRANAGDLGNRA
jgi:low affinity Fe/Cu permease